MASSLPAHVLAKAAQEQRKGEEQQMMVQHQELKDCYKDLASSLKSQVNEIQSAKHVVLEQLEKYLMDNQTLCVPLPCKTRYLRKTESTRTNTVTVKVVEDAFMLAMTESSFSEAHQEMIQEAEAAVSKAQDEAKSRFSSEIQAKKAKVQERLQGLSQNKIKVEKKRVADELEKEQALRPDNPDLAEAKARFDQIKNTPLLVDVMEQAIQSVFRRFVTKIVDKVEITTVKPRGFQLATALVMPDAIKDLCDQYDELSQRVPQVSDLEPKLQKAQQLLGLSQEEDIKTIMDKVESKIEETQQQFTGDQISIVRDGEDDAPRVENYKIFKQEKVIRSAPPLRLTTVRPLVRETLWARVDHSLIYSPDTVKQVLSSDLEDLRKKILIAMEEYKAKETQKAEVVAVRKRKLDLINEE